MTDWHVTLLGGYKRRGSAPLPDRTALITLLGGMDADLSTAPIPDGGAELAKYSIIGGIDVTVPANVRVEVTTISLLGGRRSDTANPVDPAAPVLRVRSFGVVGGVKVRRVPAPEG